MQAEFGPTKIIEKLKSLLMTFSVFSDYKYGVETSALHNLREFFYLHFATMEKLSFGRYFQKLTIM